MVAKGGDRADRAAAVGGGGGAERRAAFRAARHSRTTSAIVGKRRIPDIRKATAIVNGEVITGSDIDQRLALIVASNQIQLPPEEVERFRAQVLRNLIDETLQIQAAAQQEITVEDRDVDTLFRALRPELPADARRASAPICARSARRSGR